MTSTAAVLPSTGFVKMTTIIGDRKKGIVGVFPISRTAWLSGIKTGRYPAPVRLGPNSVAWRVEDIRAMLDRFGRGAP